MISLQWLWIWHVYNKVVGFKSFWGIMWVSSWQVRPPFLERRDNGCKFLVIDRVVNLRSCEFTWVVRFWMVYPIVIGLWGDSPNSKVWRINFHYQWLCWVGVKKYQGGHKGRFKRHECRLFCQHPTKGSVLTGECNQWLHNFGEPFNKPTIEICKAKEGLNVSSTRLGGCHSWVVATFRWSMEIPLGDMM